MRLWIQEYQKDEHGTTDCAVCDDDDQDRNLTTICFWDEKTGRAVTLCPEHLDQIVVTALKRHKKGLEEHNAFWYLDCDKVQWEGANE